jgi:Na+-driven multidrug efflux pump
MNSKLLMSLSSIFMLLVGIVLTFLPDEFSKSLTENPSIVLVTSLKFLGTFYLSFGLMNWMLKGATIGGIYNRPVVIANMLHFVMTFFILIRSLLNSDHVNNYIIILTVVYFLFAALFAKKMMSDPLKE